MAELRIHTNDRRKHSKRVVWELSGVDGLMSQLKELDHWVRNDIAEAAMQKAVKPVLQSMRANVPDSSETRSREKMSKSARNTWSGSKKLKHTLTHVIRRKGGFVTAYVGPSYSDGGGHGNLFARDHSRQSFWGRDGGSVRKVNQFVKIAADESAAMVQTIVVAVIKQELSKRIR